MHRDRSRDARAGRREDDIGSATVEFVLVGLLLTFLTLGVLQFAFVVYVRNVVHDAAVEGAYAGALADTRPEDGAARTARVLDAVLGDALEAQVVAGTVAGADGAHVRVTVTATLPLVGLIGIPAAMEVTAHAPQQGFD